MAGGTQIPAGQLSVKRIFRFEKKGPTFKIIEKLDDGRIKIKKVGVFGYTTFIDSTTQVYKA